jgi:catechol 2,3-dioxygenase-like lactoylglutathione lyase family enzyme
MHKSRLGGLIIDCRTDDLDEATAFWSAALGLQARVDPRSDQSKYRLLVTRPEDLPIEVQKVDHTSRVHIDIETDDVEAEVERLEGLGARFIEDVHHAWVVMEAPTGQRFCVINVFRDNFGEEANLWK